MKMVDISSFATMDDRHKFEGFIENCKYYAVALPHGKDSGISYMLFDNNKVTEIRVVSTLDLKYFMQSSKVIVQNGNEIFMNFEGK